MKRSILKTGLLATVLVAAASCSNEFVQENPKGVVSEPVLQDEAGINLLLVGAYARIDGDAAGNGEAGGTGGASATNWVWGDVTSDDMHRGDQTGGWSPINLIERYEVDPANPWVSELWRANYDGIARANSALSILKKAVEAGTISDAAATQLEAEGRWLRAWYHFQLRSKIERVPYIIEDIVAREVPNDREIWDDIEADLRWGIDNNMEEVPELGRASRWAAKALLSRVHLFQGEYAEAKPILDDIINNGPFELMDHFYDNHDEEKQNNKESIFEIQYTVNDGAGEANSGRDHRTLFPRGSDVGLCCAYSAPSFDLFNAFKVDADGLPLLDTFQDDLLLEDYRLKDTDPFTPTDVLLDPRVDWTIGRRGIPFLDWGPMSGADWMLDQAGMGPFLNKKIMFYKRNLGVISISSPTWSRGLNGNNWRLFRLSHIILWRAEVAVSENDLETARQLVNQIRERASDDIVMGKINNTTFGAEDPIDIDEDQPAANYLLGLYPSFPNQEFAWKAVQHETRLEFALEGMRFQDLVRWGIDGDVIPAYLQSELSDDKLLWLQGATYTPGQDDHFPIPQEELDLQQGVLTQDPAY